MRAAATLATVAAMAVTVAWTAMPAPAAMLTGLGDQTTEFFDDPSFHELGVAHVRFVAPWDAGLTGDARTAAWLDRALDAGLVPLVAFEKARGVQCPGSGCRHPSVDEFERAVAAFRARWPHVTQITPWNEPNHRSQPTAGRPRLAAQYYNAARRACHGCLLVAGDPLDGGNLAAWLAEYERALTEQPAVWGLHNYYDATYFGDNGVDTLARVTTGHIWLTETGGIVRFTPPGATGLPYDELRAADAIRWLYALAAERPRVTRMYVYHWQGHDGEDFDSGLLDPQGRPRPGWAVVRERAGMRAPVGGADTGAEPQRPVLRVSERGLRLMRRGLRVTAACVSARARCTGRIVVTTPRGTRRTSPGRRRPRLVANIDLPAGRSVVRTLALGARDRRALRRHLRRVQLTVCLAGARACRTVDRQLTDRPH